MVATIASMAILVSAQTSQATKSMDDVNKKVKDVGETSQKEGKKTEGFMKRWGAGFAAIGAAATGALYMIVKASPLLSGAMQEAQDAISLLFMTIGDALEPILRPFIDALWRATLLITSLPSPVAVLIVGLLLLSGIIFTAGLGLFILAAAAKVFGVAAATAAMGTAFMMMAIGAAMFSLTAGFVLLTFTASDAGKVLGLVFIGIGVAALVLMHHPIIAAIVGIVGMFYAFLTSSDEMRRNIIIAFTSIGVAAWMLFGHPIILAFTAVVALIMTVLGLLGVRLEMPRVEIPGMGDTEDYMGNYKEIMEHYYSLFEETPEVPQPEIPELYDTEDLVGQYAGLMEIYTAPIEAPEIPDVELPDLSAWSGIVGNYVELCGEYVAPETFTIPEPTLPALTNLENFTSNYNSVLSQYTAPEAFTLPEMKFPEIELPELPEFPEFPEYPTIPINFEVRILGERGLLEALAAGISEEVYQVIFGHPPSPVISETSRLLREELRERWGFQYGGYVPYTGPYFLHAGEHVFRAGAETGAGPGAVYNVTNNFDIHDMILTGDMDVDRLKARLDELYKHEMGQMV